MRTFKLSTAITLAVIGVLALLIAPRSITQAAPSATCTWTGPTDSTPRNWSDVTFWSCGAAPGAGDTAVINGGGIVINVDAPATVQNLTLVNGQLRGYQTLTVTGHMTWTGGSLAGGANLNPAGVTETLVIAPNASLAFAGNNILQGTLVNYGAIQHADGHEVRLLHTVIDNRTGATYSVTRGAIEKNNIFASPDDGGSFKNAGTLVKSGTGEFRVHAALSNAGAVNILSDTLKLESAADITVVTHTGTFSVSPAGTLEFFGNTHHLEPSSSITSAGVVRFSNGAQGNVRGAYNVTGLTENLATLQLDTPGGGVTLPYLRLGNGARLRGANDITVTGVLTMSAFNGIVEGSSSHTNTINIAPGATMLISQTSGLSFRTLNNYGSIVQASGQCFILINDAVFNNHSTGAYTVTNGLMGGSNCLPSGTGSRTFVNQGRMVKLGIGDFSIDTGVSVTNSGSIQVQGGVLRVDGPFAQTAGETLISDGSTLRKGAGNLTLNGGALRGTGAIDFLSSDGHVDNIGAIVDPIGSLTINNGHYAQGISGTLHVDIGNLGHDQLQVIGSAQLSGTLAISLTDNYLALPGDVFDLMQYASKTGRFSAIHNELAPAFNVVAYPTVVRLSTQPPNLLEIRKSARFQLVAPGSIDDYTIALFNTSHTIPLTVTLITDTLAPLSGFQYVTNTTRGITTINPTLQVITVPLQDGSGSVPVQALLWNGPFVVPPSEQVYLTFSISIPSDTTVSAATNYAAADYRDDTDQPLFTEVKNAAMIQVYQTSSGGGPPPEVEPSSPPSQTRPPQEPGDPPGYGYGGGTPSPSDFDVSAMLPPEAPDSATMDAVVEDGQRRGEFPMQRDPNDPRHFTATLPAASVPQGATVYAVARWPGNVMAQPMFYWYRYDPSGIVSDARSGQPVKGATVTLYRVPHFAPDPGLAPTGDCRTIQTRPGGPGGDWDNLPPAIRSLGVMEDDGFAPARMDPPLNPQVTGSDGRYGWDVIMGCWFVEVSAPGYFTGYSAVVGVPPEVTDLDIALEPWHKVYLPIVIR